MNTLLNHLYRNRHSVVELLCVISAIEGKLMEMGKCACPNLRLAAV